MSSHEQLNPISLMEVNSGSSGGHYNHLDTKVTLATSLISSKDSALQATITLKSKKWHASTLNNPLNNLLKHFKHKRTSETQFPLNPNAISTFQMRDRVSRILV